MICFVLFVSFLCSQNSATEISHFERLSRNGTEQDRQIEEPEEGHEPDLLDQQENAMREMEEERRIEAKKEEEKNKRKKIKEIDMDTQSQIDYFEEIAESLKAFACMMVDMKVVKVEIRNIKSMLQELTGKRNRDRERVREDYAREEQWKNRDGERVRKDNARQEQRKNRDGERVREDNAREEQQKNRDRERVREDTAQDKQQKNRDIERVREDNAQEEQQKERDGGKMDAGRVMLENDYRTHVNMGEDENYTGNEYTEESGDDQAEGFVDILGDDSDSGDDGFGIEERGARSIDEDSVRLDEMGEEDSRSDARISVSERDKEDLGQETISGKATSSERVTTDVEEACSKKRMAWEKLSMGVICHLYERAITKGNFARSVLRKLVDDDILVKSTCSGKGGRPYEQAIDPDILQYALETTYDVYGVEEHKKEKCRRECVQSIDSHCRQLSNSQTKKPSNREGMSERKAQGTEMPPWQRLSDKEVIGIRSCAKTMTNFVIACLRKIVSDEILVNSNCSGLPRPGSGRPNVKRIDPDILSYIYESTFKAYDIKECDKKKCIKKCITCIDARCRYLFWKKCQSESRKGTTDASMNESVPKDGRFESRHDVEKERVQSATGNDTDKDSEIENVDEEIHWESLSDEYLLDLHTTARSRGDFAKSIVRKIVGDEILVNRNCSGFAHSNSGRPNVKRIDPDILSYTFETTFNVYGVEECDKKKCIKECTTCINAHCRYLFWKKCAGKSRKGTTDASMIESIPKDGRFKSRHVEKKRVQSATGNDDTNKDGEIENIEEDVHWESLSDEDIIDIHTRARSRGDFAKSVLRKMVGDDTLINSSSSSDETVKSDGIQPIDPDILSYVIRSTHDVYGVLEAEKTKCHSECLDAIDSYCKYLRDNR